MRADRARRRGVPNDGIGGGSIRVFFSPVAISSCSHEEKFESSFIDRQSIEVRPIREIVGLWMVFMTVRYDGGVGIFSANAMDGIGNAL